MPHIPWKKKQTSIVNVPAAQFTSIIQSTGESTGESALEIERIRSELVHHTIGHRIFHYHSVASTMPIAHELAKDSAIRSGTLIIAEEQSAGRGRLERRWQAPPNSSLLMSLLLRGDLLPSQPATLMMIAGIAAIDAITQSMPTLAGKCGLKWPNDIVLGDRETPFKKVGGILIESQFSSGRLAYAVVGMGLNVQQRAEQLPQIHSGAVQATSLAAFTDGHGFSLVLLDEASAPSTHSLRTAWRASRQPGLHPEAAHELTNAP